MSDNIDKSWLLKVARISQRGVEDPGIFSSLDAYCEEMDEVDKEMESAEQLESSRPRMSVSKPDFSR